MQLKGEECEGRVDRELLQVLVNSQAVRKRIQTMRKQKFHHTKLFPSLVRASHIVPQKLFARFRVTKNSPALLMNTNNLVN